MNAAKSRLSSISLYFSLLAGGPKSGRYRSSLQPNWKRVRVGIGHPPSARTAWPGPKDPASPVGRRIDYEFRRGITPAAAKSIKTITRPMVRSEICIAYSRTRPQPPSQTCSIGATVSVSAATQEARKLSRSSQIGYVRSRTRERRPLTSRL
jgi:hypothetical protein